MVRTFNTGDATTRLYSLHPGAKQPLTAPRDDESFFLRFDQRLVVFDFLAKMLLPKHDLWCFCRRPLGSYLCPGHGTNLAAEQVSKHKR